MLIIFRLILLIILAQSHLSCGVSSVGNGESDVTVTIDISGDGVLDEKDLSVVIACSSSLAVTQCTAADVDDSGVVDEQDVSTINSLLVGTSPALKGDYVENGVLDADDFAFVYQCGTQSLTDNCEKVDELNPDGIYGDESDLSVLVTLMPPYTDQAYSADFNSDGKVDLVDFSFIRACYSRSSLADGHPCRLADSNGDRIIGNPDLNAFRLALNGG